MYFQHHLYTNIRKKLAINNGVNNGRLNRIRSLGQTGQYFGGVQTVTHGNQCENVEGGTIEAILTKFS